MHDWIQRLCDPDENFCRRLSDRLHHGWEGELPPQPRVRGGWCGGDALHQEEGVKRRVGSISLAGITAPEEVELLEGEVPQVVEVGQALVCCMMYS